MSNRREQEAGTATKDYGPMPAGASTRKRDRVAWSPDVSYESDDSDSASSTNQRPSSRPKKRFIWPENLHRDFVAAVFDVGLKKADPTCLKDLVSKKDRSMDPKAMRSTLQKLRSFRYQMRTALGGDNLDTPEELEQKGAIPSAGLALRHQHSASMGLTALSVATDVTGTEDKILREAQNFPRDFAGALESLDGIQVKRSVELMGQCVQVQQSAHRILLQAIQTQEALKGSIVEKVKQMGLPVNDIPGSWANGQSNMPSQGEHARRNGTNGPGRLTFSVRVSGTGSTWPQAAATQGRKDGRSEVESTPNNAGIGGLELLAFSAQNPGSLLGAGSAASTQTGAATQLADQDTTASGRVVGSAPPSLLSEASSGRPQERLSQPPPAPPPTSSPVLALPSGSSRNGVVTAFDPSDWEPVPSATLQGQMDETSLRMEMKTSMDIHRLMRSRQQDQLELHPQQKQRQHQESQRKETEPRSTSPSKPGSSVEPTAAPTANRSSSQPDAPTAGSSSPTHASSSSPTPTSTAQIMNSSEADAVRASNSTTDVVGAPGRTSVSGDGGGTSAPGGAGVEAPQLTGDWTWDDDPFDAHLFSFLLETE